MRKVKTVFVDVTAEWCITCKANKIGVILQDPVYSHLQQEDIVLMKGDWTTPSESVNSHTRKVMADMACHSTLCMAHALPKRYPLPVILNSETVVQAIDEGGS
ncbi:thioredoxin family protein [Vibrio chagasii]|nr:thioredoxin family protein [Vibrio chagasii]